VTALLADAVYYQGADLMAFRRHVTALLLIVVSLLLPPPLPFAPRLVQARGEGLLFRGGSGSDDAAHLESLLRVDASDWLPSFQLFMGLNLQFPK